MQFLKIQLTKKKKEIAELENKSDYSNLIFVITKEKLYNFNNYRNSSILFHNIGKKQNWLNIQIYNVNLNMHYMI